MRRARVGLLGVVAAVTLASGCADPLQEQNAAPQQEVPPAPTAPVGADGQPITTLCDLLTDQDFTSIAKETAKKPDTSDATETKATCVYGENMTLRIAIGATIEEAQSLYQQAVKDAGFTMAARGVMAGTDESEYGRGDDASGLSLRRRKLVVSIVVPDATQEAQAKLVQLAGILLSRAHALGA